MSISPGSMRRRASVENQYRSAILDAASALMVERGGPAFTVDELAVRAEVARRTVFNYFPSLDDVIIAECRRLLARVMGGFEAAAAPAPSGPATRQHMFDEVTDALRETDFPTGIAAVWAALGGGGQPTGRSREFTFDALSSTADQLVVQLARRSSGADILECEILAGALTSGIVVITKHWLAATNGETDNTARRLWAQLLDQLIESTRMGYR